MTAVLYLGLAVATVSCGGLAVLYFPGVSGIESQVAYGWPLIALGLTGLILVGLALYLSESGDI